MVGLVRGLVVLLLLTSCEQSDTSGGLKVCIDSGSIDLGEIVSYRITYPDDKTTDFTFEGIDTNKAYHTDSEGRQSTQDLSDECATSEIIQPVELNFFLRGARLNGLLETEGGSVLRVIDDEENVADGADRTVVESVPGTCGNETINIVGRDLLAIKCNTVKDKNNLALVSYKHNDLGEASPLSGFLKFTLTDPDGREIVVELTEWNGL